MPRRTFPVGSIFAESAPELTSPDASWPQGYESGAGKQPPEAGVHNYEFKRLDEMSQHVEQNGVPRWDTRTSYALGGWCLGSDGMLYRAKLAHSGQNPVGGDGTYWRSITSVTAEQMYPVGSAIMRPTNPGLAESSGGLGFGTWSDKQGRSPIGAGSYIDGNGEQRLFSTGNSYGEFSHTLTIDEMPSHDHELWGNNNDTNGQPTAPPLRPDDAEAEASADVIRDTGGDEPHNTLHPVFAVKIWYRTA